MSNSLSQAPSHITTSKLRLNPNYGPNAVGTAIDLEFENLSVHLAFVDGRLENISLWDNLTERVIGSHPYDLVNGEDDSNQLEFDWDNETVH